jgi:hypothetical protein
MNHLEVYKGCYDFDVKIGETKGMTAKELDFHMDFLLLGLVARPILTKDTLLQCCGLSSKAYCYPFRLIDGSFENQMCS